VTPVKVKWQEVWSQRIDVRITPPDDADPDDPMPNGTIIEFRAYASRQVYPHRRRLRWRRIVHQRRRM
jgi:hypothetical protein